VDELTGIVLETVRRNDFRQDAYIRPSFYKSTRTIGVRLHHLDHELYVVALPFGNYIDTEKGVRLMTSSWRRNADEAIPARGKIVGGYVNMAFQKSEAELNGYDEALVLTPDGHASEASAANLFVVRDGVILTPPVSDDILEGVTRKAIITLARDLGIPVEVRSIDRSELYVCDEIFLCGTGVQVSPVIEVDHRAIGTARSARSRAGSASATSRGARQPARVPSLADRGPRDSGSRRLAAARGHCGGSRPCGGDESRRGIGSSPGACASRSGCSGRP
jgi:branched-chain amino acid aminotransferase